LYNIIGILIFRVGRGGLVSWGFVGRSGGLVGGCRVNGSFVCRSRVSGCLVGGSWGFVFRSLVGWGRVRWSGVSWGSVGWCGVRSSRFVFGLFGVLGLSFVFHISVVSILVGLVGDDLSAAIGKSNTVRSGDDVVIGFLRVEEIVVRFLILDVVFETVRLRGLFKMRCNPN
jgi:hypothetical protein